jgi:DNA-binding NarL/FixJ family response regulator
MAIRVLLVDDFQILIWGIQKLLETDPNIELIGVANTHDQALLDVTSLKPDVVLINSAKLENGAIELIPKILNAVQTNILVISGNLEDEMHDLVVIKGARGILNKNDSAQTLLKAIDRVHAGEIWVNRNATSRILLEIAKASTPKPKTPEQLKLESLTKKESKIIQSIIVSSGKSYKVIAGELNISEHTLRNHLAAIYGKVGVKSRMELYVFCVENQKNIQ